MKLATKTSDYISYDISATDALRHIKKAGFKYADYSFSVDFYRSNGIYSEDYRGYIEEVKAASEEIGIRLIQAHAPMGAPLADGGKLFKDTVRCIEACGAWGIPNLVVHSGYVKGLTREQTLSENREFFLKLLVYAEKYGVNILVENFNRMDVEGLYWIDNATDLLEMIECVNHPLFHAVWDVGHANMQKMPQNEEMKILGKHIRALHIHDNWGDDDSHMAPFLGTLSLDDVISGLKDIGYDGYFTFEVGNFFAPSDKRRKYQGSELLAKEPIEIRDAFERYLYELGKCVLEKHGCFEE